MWLTSLAERSSGRQFLEQYRDDLADDSLRCQSFTARIELDRTTDLAPLIATHWLTPRSLPDCERAFDWLRAQNALTPELIEQRARLALKENNSRLRAADRRVPAAERAAPLLQWAALLETAAATDRCADRRSATPVEAEALLAGWTQLRARQSRCGDAALSTRSCARAG